MGVEQVVKVLEIANNNLPLVEHKCERLKREVDDLEANKHNSARILQDLSDQISYLRKICKEQRLDLTKIQLQKVRIQGLVDNFQNDNEEYIKIKKTVEEQVESVLSDRKMLLKLEVLSLTESIRQNLDKYGSLIYQNTPQNAASTDYSNSQYYAAFFLWTTAAIPITELHRYAIGGI